MLKLVMMPLLCGCVLLVDGPAPAQEPAPDCKAPQTQTDMTICAGQDLADADSALNVQYQATRKVMKSRDADAVSEDQKGAEAALLKAQRAWIVYRDAECDLRGYQARGGSMEPMLVSNCAADLTRERTKDLKALAENL